MDEHTAAVPQGVDPALLTIVGIGASAGGLEALRTLFAHTPGDLGVVYLVMLSVLPDAEAVAETGLDAVTTLPVHRVRERVQLRANHVYVVPPARGVEVDGNQLSLASTSTVEQRRTPIDWMFRAIADARGSRAVGIVLSGGGPHGSSGLQRVKEYGGLALVQDPREALDAEMPRHAEGTGLADAVLRVQDIPAQIASFQSRLLHEVDAPSAPQEQSDVLRDVLALLRTRTGQDFSNYKRATVLRRLERRMHVRGVPTLEAYVRVMRDHPQEATALMKDLLISVTNFFRDRDAFDLLESRVIPAICEHRDGREQVRAWVAGCATGEEAYSLAMLLAEYGERATAMPTVQIFATDLADEAIAAAREGFYTAAEVADVSEERLQRFFQREPGGFRVRRDLREMVLFARHNVITDPSFSHLDLISCRNLLIYLDRRAQERVMETFHFALRPERYLFLGTSESPDGASDLFTPVDKDLRLYQSRAVATRPAVLPRDTPLLTLAAQTRKTPESPRDRILPLDLHHRVLEEYAPPSLLVSAEGTVLHVTERAGRYLKVGAGEPSRELSRLVHPDLSLEMRTALLQALREGRPVQAARVRMRTDDSDALVTITVRPVLRDDHPARGFALVLFDEARERPSAPKAGETAAAARAPELLARQLEEELGRVRGQAHATAQQYETQVEDAKATNQELQAINEELRSAAEELETSKEELQSLNEELTTVNQELKVKIEELGLTNNDFRNLMNSTEIGTIFLDRSFRVKLSTPRARDVFNLLPGDIGRRLSDITSRLRDDSLHDDIRLGLERLHTVDREVETRDGRWYLMRVLPYRTAEDRIEGVVVTFQDISTRREAEMRVRDSDDRLRLLIDSAADYAIFTMTRDGVVDTWNIGAERLFGYAAEDIVGQSAAIVFTPEDRAAGVFEQERRTALEQGRAEDERWHLRRDGTRLYCSGVTNRLVQGEKVGLVKICRDLTAQREADVALQGARADLEERVVVRTRELRSEVEQHAAAEERVLHLLRRVVTAQEDERRRIARDLHDQLGQQLTAMRLALERHTQTCSSVEHLARAQELASQIDAELDFLAWELRPTVLDDLGLGAALPRYAAEWSAHYKVAAECRTDGYAPGTLPQDGEVAFYRVLQEALNNIAKHAHARRVDILLDTREDAVVLVIEDDGVGFEPAEVGEQGFGLISMRERAALVQATLEIESEPNRGTTVFLRRPLS